jgi:hypothetical protein
MTMAVSVIHHLHVAAAHFDASLNWLHLSWLLSGGNGGSNRRGSRNHVRENRQAGNNAK